MSYDNNDDLAGSGKDKLSHTHFSLSYSRERVREQRRSFSGRMPFKQSDSLTSTTHTHTHTHQPIYFIFSVFWGLGKSSTWFNSHIDIICSFFSLHTHTKKVISFSEDWHYSDMAAKIRPNSFSLQFMDVLPHHKKINKWIWIWRVFFFFKLFVFFTF